MEKELKHISKFISLVLRHQPEVINLHLDENGWADVTELLDKMNKKGIKINIDTLNTIVETNDKKRFAFSDDKTKIRASQGHSIEVDLALKPVTPPAVLYHGTTAKYLESIFKTGLQKQSRQHLHLSETIDTAKAVGSRHGKPIILTINAAQMHSDGYQFYLSANNVWLTEMVPVQYIQQNDQP